MEVVLKKEVFLKQKFLLIKQLVKILPGGYNFVMESFADSLVRNMIDSIFNETLVFSTETDLQVVEFQKFIASIIVKEIHDKFNKTMKSSNANANINLSTLFESHKNIKNSDLFITPSRIENFKEKISNIGVTVKVENRGIIRGVQNGVVKGVGGVVPFVRNFAKNRLLLPYRIIGLELRGNFANSKFSFITDVLSVYEERVLENFYTWLWTIYTGYPNISKTKNGKLAKTNKIPVVRLNKVAYKQIISNLIEQINIILAVNNKTSKNRKAEMYDSFRYAFKSLEYFHKQIENLLKLNQNVWTIMNLRGIENKLKSMKKLEEILQIRKTSIWSYIKYSFMKKAAIEIQKKANAIDALSKYLQTNKSTNTLIRQLKLTTENIPNKILHALVQNRPTVNGLGARVPTGGRINIQ